MINNRSERLPLEGKAWGYIVNSPINCNLSLRWILWYCRGGCLHPPVNIQRDDVGIVPYNHNTKHPAKLQFKPQKTKTEFAYTFRMGAVGRMFPWLADVPIGKSGKGFQREKPRLVCPFDYSLNYNLLVNWQYTRKPSPWGEGGLRSNSDEVGMFKL